MARVLQSRCDLVTVRRLSHVLRLRRQCGTDLVVPMFPERILDYCSLPIAMIKSCLHRFTRQLTLLYKNNHQKHAEGRTVCRDCQRGIGNSCHVPHERLLSYALRFLAYDESLFNIASMLMIVGVFVSYHGRFTVHIHDQESGTILWLQFSAINV